MSKHFSRRKSRSLWIIIADLSICSKFTSHSSGFALDFAPELPLFVPTAGEINSLEAKSIVPSGCTPGSAVSIGSPFPYRNCSKPGAGQIQQGNKTCGKMR